MKSKPILILGLFTLGFACIAGYFATENAKLRAALAKVESASLAIGPSVKNNLAAGDSMEVATEEQAAEQTSVEPPPATEEAQEDRQQRRQEARQERAQEFLSMLQDPEQRLNFIERNMERIDRRYADFFATLNLSGEQIEVLKTLMAERGIIGNESRIRVALADSEEEKEAIREEMRLQRELLDGDVVALLGEEQAAGMERYDATLPFRGDVEDFARSLSYTDTPVSDEQSEALLDTYAALNQEFKFSEDLSDGNRFRRGDVSAESVQTYFQEKKVFDTMVLEQASAYLDDAQLASLAEKQIVERERTQQRMEIMLQRGSDGRRGGPGGDFRRGGGRGGF